MHEYVGAIKQFLKSGNINKYTVNTVIQKHAIKIRTVSVT